MVNLNLKYATYMNALPPRPIRLEIGGWSGTHEKMVDGSNPQPWHCLPFVEGSTYGLELVYAFETPCDVVNDNGNVRFEWDFANEPGGVLTGSEFLNFSPVRAAKYYLLNTRIDLQTPPGYVVRTEPHPRFFTDDSGTFPLAMIGHLQNEWYPRQLFVVFRAPRPGQRHIFRKGEPHAQIIFVPKQMSYELTKMTPEEEKRRRELERNINVSRFDIAENNWRHPDDVQFNNHYKVLARAYAREGMAGVDKEVREATERRDRAFPLDKTIPEYLEMGFQLLAEKRYEDAHRCYAHVLGLDGQNAEALSQIGICLASLGGVTQALQVMTGATQLAPHVPKYHWNLAELLRRLGRFREAEASIRAALRVAPNNPGALCFLAFVLAQQGRFVDARACYEAALAIDPSDSQAQRGLQELLATTG
jgi:tetratricopeptide (TPR) repeat protein